MPPRSSPGRRSDGQTHTYSIDQYAPTERADCKASIERGEQQPYLAFCFVSMSVRGRPCPPTGVTFQCLADALLSGCLNMYD